MISLRDYTKRAAWLCSTVDNSSLSAQWDLTEACIRPSSNSQRRSSCAHRRMYLACAKWGGVKVLTAKISNSIRLESELQPGYRDSELCMLGEHSASSDNRLGCQISHRAIFTSSRCSAATRVAGIIESVRYCQLLFQRSTAR